MMDVLWAGTALDTFSKVQDLFDALAVLRPLSGETREATRVKLALLRADNVDAGDVHVTTTGGAVKLTGHVASAAQKQKAGEVVQGLDGVTTVENDLAIGGAEK